MGDDVRRIRRECSRRANAEYREESNEELISYYNAHCDEIDILSAHIERLKRKLRCGGRKPKLVVDHGWYHRNIERDYFGTRVVYDNAGNLVKKKKKARFPVKRFHRRFRMSQRLFERIFWDITDPEIGHHFFFSRPDATGVLGPSSLQKVCAAIRQLAYGTASDHVEEYTGVADSTALSCLRKFCKFVIRQYGPEYLGAWKERDIKKEMKANADRGFPGMLGSIDCTHWQWKMCPISWQGMYQDRNRKRSIVAEAIAGHDMYFFQAFVGCPGSMNDLNIMGVSTMQSSYMNSCAIDQKFTIYGREFKGAYFLADGIYPDFPYFVKTVSVPITPQEKQFAKVQEGCRKDVERAFGRLLAKWHILSGAGRSWKIKYMRNIWTTCFILHNMTLRDQQMTETEFLEQEEARYHIGEGESIFADNHIELSDDDDDDAPDPSDDTVDLSFSDSEDDSGPTGVPTGVPTSVPARSRMARTDTDATDDEVDYEEGIDRGFRAVRLRKEGRDFNGVMAAIKQMEDKSECIIMREKLIDHVWALPRSTA